MFYKFLYEKFLMNNKYSVSPENTLYSILIQFSMEIALNIMSLLILLDFTKYYPFSNKRNLLFFLIIPFSIGLFISFF